MVIQQVSEHILHTAVTLSVTKNACKTSYYKNCYCHLPVQQRQICCYDINCGSSRGNQSRSKCQPDNMHAENSSNRLNQGFFLQKLV